MLSISVLKERSDAQKPFSSGSPTSTCFVETPPLPFIRFHKHNSIFLSLYLSLSLPCLWLLNEAGQQRFPDLPLHCPFHLLPECYEHPMQPQRSGSKMSLGSEELAGLGTFQRLPRSPCQAQKKVFPTFRSSWNLGWAFVRLAVCKWPFYDRTQLGSMLTLSSPERTASNVSVHILKSVLGWLWGN